MAPWVLLVSVASAKSPGWFRDGAAGVELPSDGVVVPLLRGPTTAYLPAVEVRLPIDGQDRPALAVLDVAGRWSRLSPETANALGLIVTFTKIDGQARRVVVLDQVRIGPLVVEGLKVEIDDDAPGLVLGLRSLPELGVAILASEGVVRFVDADGAEALLRTVGEPIAAGDGATDGLTLQVPGALRWGEAVVGGTFHLRTDLATSRVAPSDRLPDPTIRAGARYHDVGARLGDVALPDTWIREDEALADPTADFAGALGYDVLFGLDLAVSPDGLLAFRAAPTVHWSDATAASVAAAKERYAQEETLAAGTADVTVAPTESKVVIGFDGPSAGGAVLGEKGNPVVRDRNLDLAETLWRAGALEEALPHYLFASQFAGDHCGAHLLLGERRLANAGAAVLGQDMVAKLVTDPIERAALLWDAWLGLPSATRDAVAAGQLAPEGSLQVLQPARCATARGLFAAVQRARGASVSALDVGPERDLPSVVYARALAAIGEGRFTDAALLLDGAYGAGVDPADLQVAIVLTRASSRPASEVLVAAVREIPGHPTDHPLTTALGVLSAARRSDADEVTRRLFRADEHWVPALLVRSLATGQPPPPWDPGTSARAPGSPQVSCQQALHQALSGDVAGARRMLAERRWPAVADWWAASAVVARLAGDHAAADQAVRELRLRFPLIPPSDLGMPAPPPPPPPAPKGRRRPG